MTALAGRTSTISSLAMTYLMEVMLSSGWVGDIGFEDESS